MFRKKKKSPEGLNHEICWKSLKASLLVTPSKVWTSGELLGHMLVCEINSGPSMGELFNRDTVALSKGALDEIRDFGKKIEKEVG